MSFVKNFFRKPKLTFSNFIIFRYARLALHFANYRERFELSCLFVAHGWLCILLIIEYGLNLAVYLLRTVSFAFSLIIEYGLNLAVYLLRTVSFAFSLIIEYGLNLAVYLLRSVSFCILLIIEYGLNLAVYLLRTVSFALKFAYRLYIFLFPY